MSSLEGNIPEFSKPTRKTYRDMTEEEFREYVVDMLYGLYRFTCSATYSNGYHSVWDDEISRSLFNVMDYYNRDKQYRNNHMQEGK